MKKYVIAIAMVLTLSMNADAAAQNHRHTPRTEQVDSTKNNQDAIEAFSDTTSVADAEEDNSYTTGRTTRVYSDEDVKGVMEQVFGSLDGEDIAGMIFVLLIIFIMFFLAPIGILIAIFYFINKNRREKYKLAQVAMQNGQPIPDQILKDRPDGSDHSDYQSGIRQMCLGVGLAIFLGITAGKIGFGIGALVFFIGLGKWYIARQSQGNKDDFMNHNNSSNNSNIQNYD